MRGEVFPGDHYRRGTKTVPGKNRGSLGTRGTLNNNQIAPVLLAEMGAGSAQTNASDRQQLGKRGEIHGHGKPVNTQEYSVTRVYSLAQSPATLVRRYQASLP
jgi:hypothetical protein